MSHTNQHDTPEPTTRPTSHAIDQRSSSDLDVSHPLTAGSPLTPKTPPFPRLRSRSTVAGRFLRSGRPRPYQWQRWRGS